MVDKRNEIFLNKPEERTASFTDEKIVKFERIVEERGRAAAPVIAEPIGAAPAQSTNMGVFVPSNMPEFRGRDNLGIFLKRF